LQDYSLTSFARDTDGGDSKEKTCHTTRGFGYRQDYSLTSFARDPDGGDSKEKTCHTTRGFGHRQDYSLTSFARDTDGGDSKEKALIPHIVALGLGRITRSLRSLVILSRGD